MPDAPASQRLGRSAFGGRRLLVGAVTAGFLYGLFMRLCFGFSRLDGAFTAVSIAFLFLVPLVLGFLVVAIAERAHPLFWGWWLVAPWPAAMLCLLAALVLGWEGLICIVIWAPLFAVMSTLGGVAAGVWRRVQRRHIGGAALLGALLLPLLAAPIEGRFSASDGVRTVATAIDVAAGPALVWRQIVDVPTIRPAEHRWSWVHAMGFPRPVAARSSGSGAGSVRHATFERGVLFVETISTWLPERALAFSIRAAPIPPGTLDEHVSVGGRYFDVLEGSYGIEPLGPQRVRLHLASRHRLSTRFNVYSGMWTDAILRETQLYILRIVARRAEEAAATGVDHPLIAR